MGLIILFILLLQYSLVSYSFVLHTESSPTLQAFRVEPYVDGTVLIEVKDIHGIGCSEPMLRFRIVRPEDGAVMPVDMSLPIPDFNFNNCEYFNRSDKRVEYDIGTERQHGIRVYALTPRYLLVTYLNTTDAAASPAIYGLIINWQGEILS
jgi:hypothetical protein